jgi:TRAP-type uncharacterized transport system substrate-binding protein
MTIGGSALLGLGARRAAAVLAIACSLAGPAHAQSLYEQANRGAVAMVIAPDSTSVRIAQDLADVLDDGATRRLLPIVGRGAFHNLVDLKLLRGVDMGIIRMDVLEAARGPSPYAGMADSLTYVARLFREELHVLVPAAIGDIAELNGKRVSFAATAMPIGPKVFDLLNIKVETSSDDPGTALHKLRTGQLDAVVLMGGKPVPLAGDLRPDDRLRFLSVPFTKDMASVYLPAWLTAEDYPQLVTTDSPVNTIAVDAVLFVAPLQAKSDRFRNVANLVEAFFTQFPRLQEPGRHSKWQEVDISADLPGWRRFAPAEAWLQRNAVASSAPLGEEELREVFTRFLEERSRLMGSRGMSAAEKAQLFDLFLQWQKSQGR